MMKHEPVRRLLPRASVCVIAIASVSVMAIAEGIHDPDANYFCIEDSPFASIDFSGGYFHLENFEDGFLDTIGVSSAKGLVLLRNDVHSDSVDCDDGTIDNNGNTGGATTGAMYSAGSFTLTFAFDEKELGGYLPTHVGIVMTDALTSSDIIFSAYRAGELLGSIMGHQVAEGMHFTEEDRFYGFIDDGGIDEVLVAAASENDWAMDHLQYGNLIACTADLNDSGAVDVDDLLLLLSMWGEEGGVADIDGSGLVDVNDLLRVLAAWGPCPE